MWTLPRSVSKPAAGAGALFVRIADAITEDIRRGVLRTGDRLPSTRELARQLAVNRNTVVAAFDELVAQGWVAPDGARGTRVLPVRSEERPPRGKAPRTAGFALREVAAPLTPFGSTSVRYHVSVGVPDTRLLPHAAL